jgi:hypothetical protein
MGRWLGRRPSDDVTGQIGRGTADPLGRECAACGVERGLTRRRQHSDLPRRRLRKESDGALSDVDERRRIGLDELRDDIRAGRYFRAVRHSSGEDCTQEVLAQVLASSVLKPQFGAGGLGSVVSSLLGGALSGSSRVFDRTAPAPRGAPRQRDGQSTERQSWWDGD